MRVTVNGEQFNGFKIPWINRFVVSLFYPASWYVCKPCEKCGNLILPLNGCSVEHIETSKEER